MMNNSIQKQYFDLKKTPKYAPMPDLTKKSMYSHTTVVT